MKPRVILLAIDGVRAMALAETACPNFDSLKQRAAFTLQARSVMPSITLPCFLSIFHSIPPDRHGTPHNTFIPMVKPVPGLVETLHAQGKRAAFFYNWEPLRDLNAPLSLSYSYFIDNLSDGPDSDRVVAEQALAQLPGADWDFVFIYFGSLDVAGHKHGFMSAEYLAQLSRLDAVVGMVIRAIPADTHLMLITDHGGHARTHGTDSPDDMIIPFFLTGPRIRSAFEIQTPITLLDIAPTISRLLDIQPHPEWEGRAIDSAFIDRRWATDN